MRTRSGPDHREQSFKPCFRVTPPSLYSKPCRNVPSFPCSCLIFPKSFHGRYLPVLAPNPRNLPRLLFVPSDWIQNKNRQTRAAGSTVPTFWDCVHVHLCAYLCARVFGYMYACMNTDLGGQESKKGLGAIIPIPQMGKTEAKAGGLSGNKRFHGSACQGPGSLCRIPLPEEVWPAYR